MANLNLKFYKNQDNDCYYALHNLDSEAIEFLKDPENDEKAKEKYPEIYYYFLSRHSGYLLRWCDFKPDSDILEISSGIGTNTKVLCSVAKTVTSVNFSKTNAEIIASRLKEYDNLEIITGNLKDIEFEKKFDYIVLVDIFEFFNVFSRTPVEFLHYLKSHLKENGVIICALSNKYGFSDFSGGVSHITGKAFDNINGYPNVPFLNVFTKRQLNHIFRASGFKNVQFYYPIPNHYTNRTILSDKSIANAFIGEKIPSKFRGYYINPNNLINEKMFVSDLMLSDFTFFVNSYLVFLSDDNPQEISYAQVNKGILTTITDEYCKKTALVKEKQEALTNMLERYDKETKRLEENNIQNVSYAKCKMVDGSLILDIAKGTPMNKIALVNLFNNNALLAVLMEYKSFIYKLYPKHVYQDFKFDDVVLENVACATDANIDINLSNIYKDEDRYTIIDYDNFANVIPLNYIVAQGVFVLAIDSEFAFRDIEYLKELGLSDKEIAVYQAIFAKNAKK